MRFSLLALGLALVLAACQRPAPMGTSSDAPQATAATRAVPPATENPEIQRLLAAARDAGETELNVSWSPNSIGGFEAIGRFETLFNQIYGTSIKINLTPGPSMPDMVAKISQEFAAERKASSDVFLGNESHVASLLQRDVLEPYDYTLLSTRITPDLVAVNDVAVQIYSSIPAILYNTDLVPPAQAPKTLEDVLDPKWKGKIASTPYASPLDRVAQRPEWSPERMKTFVARLSQQIGGLIRAAEENRIVSGEFVMFVMSNTHSARHYMRKGAPIGYALPPDGAVAGFGHLGIPRNSARPNLGKLFINVVMTEEGQRVIWETYAADNHKLPGSGSAPEVAELKAQGSGIFDIDVKLVLERPEIRHLTVELDRILTEGR
jgi:ABC-type Fe3+ transport system substrate-binding protein